MKKITYDVPSNRLQAKDIFSFVIARIHNPTPIQPDASTQKLELQRNRIAKNRIIILKRHSKKDHITICTKGLFLD